MLFFFGPHGNIEKLRSKFMFLRFCKARSRETRGEFILELFPTIPTYQNRINMNPGPLLCKVSRVLGFVSFFLQFSQFVGSIEPGPHGAQQISCAPPPTNIVCATPKKISCAPPQKLSCAPPPTNLVCATPNKYRVRHSQQISCAPLLRIVSFE